MSRAAEFTVFVPGPLRACCGGASELALREILDNYLDNAIEASGTGTQIELLVVASSRDVDVIVRDQGKGLTDEQRLRAFDRFWRAPGDSYRPSGSGLGLAVVAQLADAAGIHVELRHSPTGGVDASAKISRTGQ